GALFVTNDQLLRRFAAGRRSSRFSLVIMPTQLLQVLRPFCRNTPVSDEAFVDALCCQEFRSAHLGNYAEEGSRVLSFLAAYGHLPTGTAVSILANEVLMRKASTTEDLEELRAAVDQALVDENTALVEARAE